MANTEMFEQNLPPYLANDLAAWKKGVAEGPRLLDCLWGELYGSINIAEINDSAITHEHAQYLRDKYLWGKDALAILPIAQNPTGLSRRKTCADMHWPDIAIREEFNPERTITLLMLPDTADTEKPSIGSKKLDIGGKKLDIETEQPLVHTKLEAIGFSLPTRCNIERLIANITPEEVFGRSRIEEILDLSHGAASNLLRTMKENGLLESIKGRGKGKYRFTSQYWRES